MAHAQKVEKPLPAPEPGPGLGGFSWAGLGVAVPDLALSFVFLAIWISPESLPEKTISRFMLIMLLEFIIVHSSAFMGVLAVSDQDRAKKVTGLFGLGLFYTLFVGGFALTFHSWWPLGSFWMLMLNRMLGVLFGQAPVGRAKEYVMASWAASAAFYLGFVFLTTLAPLPSFGITPAVVSAEHLPGSGLWISQPHRVIAFGFLYFLAQGIWELAADWRLRKAMGVRPAD